MILHLHLHSLYFGEGGVDSETLKIYLQKTYTNRDKKGFGFCPTSMSKGQGVRSEEKERERVDVVSLMRMTKNKRQGMVILMVDLF